MSVNSKRTLAPSGGRLESKSASATDPAAILGALVADPAAFAEREPYGALWDHLEKGRHNDELSTCLASFAQVAERPEATSVLKVLHRHSPAVHELLGLTPR